MKRNKQYILLLITATLILVSGCKTARKATSGREGIFKEKEVFMSSVQQKALQFQTLSARMEFLLVDCPAMRTNAFRPYLLSAIAATITGCRQR